MPRDDLAVVSVVKHEDAAHPVAATWRPVICEIVRAFSRGDYLLSQPVADVDAISEATAEHIRASVADYGATLVELPDETWETSRAQWMVGHWEVIVDLWTKEEGQSDLVLSLTVTEAGAGHRFRVHLVYVP